jgi:hypothetical protein
VDSHNERAAYAAAFLARIGVAVSGKSLDSLGIGVKGVLTWEISRRMDSRKWHGIQVL